MSHLVDLIENAMLEGNCFVRGNRLRVVGSYTNVADYHTQCSRSRFVLATTFSTVKPNCLKISW